MKKALISSLFLISLLLSSCGQDSEPVADLPDFDLSPLMTMEQLDSAPVYTNINEALANASEVYVLDLTQQDLTVFPEEIFTLRNLQRLYLDENDIAVLPAGIAKLENLQDFSMYFNELTDLPDDLFELKHLTTLNLVYNKLTELPEDLAQLQTLENLYLSVNYFVDFPMVILKLSNLKELTMAKCDLTALPDDIFTKLSKLESFWIDKNPLTGFPEGVDTLQNLRELNVNGTQLAPEIFDYLRTVVPADVNLIIDSEDYALPS